MCSCSILKQCACFFEPNRGILKRGYIIHRSGIVITKQAEAGKGFLDEEKTAAEPGTCPIAHGVDLEKHQEDRKIRGLRVTSRKSINYAGPENTG